MDVVLVRVQEDGRTSPVPIRRPRTLVGRQTDCNLRVPAIDVSRKHCEITIVDDELVVKDLGSRNGTFVNGEKTDVKELSEGDVLSVGPLVFVVQIDGEPAEFDARAKYQIGADLGDDTPSSGGKSEHADEPTRIGSGAKAAPGSAAAAAGAGGLLDDVGLSNADDDSSVIDFDFDFDEDEDDQPPL